MSAGVVFMCALALLRADDTPAAAAPAPAPSYHASVLKLFGKDVIAVDAAKIDPASISTKKYLFIYLSAHWCPPCRVFTPKLVAYYNKNYAANGDFDLVFVSSDHSQAEMNSYMKGEKMPWIGLKLGSKAAAALKKKTVGNGIPCLILLDENDKVIAESFDSNRKYLGPDNALKAYEKLRKTKAK